MSASDNTKASSYGQLLLRYVDKSGLSTAAFAQRVENALVPKKWFSASTLSCLMNDTRQATPAEHEAIASVLKSCRVRFMQHWFENALERCLTHEDWVKENWDEFEPIVRVIREERWPLSMVLRWLDEKASPV